MNDARGGPQGMCYSFERRCRATDACGWDALGISHLVALRIRQMDSGWSNDGFLSAITRDQPAMCTLGFGGLAGARCPSGPPNPITNQDSVTSLTRKKSPAGGSPKRIVYWQAWQIAVSRSTTVHTTITPHTPTRWRIPIPC